MRLDIRPTLSSLMRSCTGAILVSIQIAVTLAIVVNALYIAKQRLDRISRPTGVDEDNVFVISTAGFTDRFRYRATVENDLRYLRGMDGVVAATAISAVPLSGSGRDVGLTTRPDDHELPVDANYFEVDDQALEALGVKLIAGRDFRREDIERDESAASQATATEITPEIIVTRDLAAALFPNVSALGRNVYLAGASSPARIIGIVDHMYGEFLGSPYVANVVLSPRLPRIAQGESYYYLVRAVPGERDRLMGLAGQHLEASNPDRVLDWVQPLTTFKRVSYAFDTIVAGFLWFVTVVLICIAALGIFGLTTFNVTTRTKQIGTRRAVGARRRDIVRYFLLENALITTAGIVCGCALALAIGYWLSVQNHLPRLDLYYLVGGVLGLYAIGQLAAWQPAWRAAAVPPSIATRTV